MLARPLLRYSIGLWLLLALCLELVGCGTQSNAAAANHQDGPAYTANTPQGSPTPAGTAISEAGPRRLIIPAIAVDAPIEEVGILASGDLQTPTRDPWVNTGWYKDGPEPGQQGSSVIDGHLDRPGGYPAVFWRLRDLKVGNEVELVDSSGKTLHFRVTDVEYYQPLKAPLQQIFGDSGGKYLNLITCAGDWIPSQSQTTLREVVYTTLTT